MKLKTTLALILLFPLIGMSQVELAPFAGYMFGGRVNYYQGELKIEDNMDYGVSIIVPDIQWGTDLEINYTRMDSRARFRANPTYPNYDDADFDISVNYIQIGAQKVFTP